MFAFAISLRFFAEYGIILKLAKFSNVRKVDEQIEAKRNRHS